MSAVWWSVCRASLLTLKLHLFKHFDSSMRIIAEFADFFLSAFHFRFCKNALFPLFLLLLVVVCVIWVMEICVFSPKFPDKRVEWMNTNNDSLIPCLAVQFLSSKNVHFFCDCSRRIPFLFVITSTDRDRQTWQFLLLNCYSHFHIFVRSSQSLRAIKMAILNYVLFTCLRLFFRQSFTHFALQLQTSNT